jgi:quinol-cytochrome oxidoreductase complex cytochrome b subunit
MHAVPSRPYQPFWICLLLISIVLLFTGAVGSCPEIGRYQMTTVVRGNFTDIFVIDTTTGVVKWLGGDEGKPFEAVKGK